MDIKFIIKNIENKKLKMSLHAINRLHERNMLIDDILNSIIYGEIIEEYKDDYPYPSCLIMGKYGDRVIHSVCSFSEPVYIITAYEPDLNVWNEDYKTRK